MELLQDFEFPSACQRIKFTPDEQYIFATGYHAPRVRVYDVNQLSMKFERHFDSEVVDFQILTDDYSKAVFLCADRSLSFHARFGGYYKTRIPKFGRNLAYAPYTAELLVASSSPELYRMSLSEGRFMTPLETKSEAVNVCGVSPAHGLVACAGDDGGLECFDLRQRQSLGWFDAARAAGGEGQELTALRFDSSGMNIAVGTSGGLVALFDLRSRHPITVKDHMYSSKIVDIKFHSGKLQGVGIGGSSTERIVSSDRHIIKIWDAATGRGHTNIEPPEGYDINDVAICGDSGLIFAGCDTPRIQAYFVPSLGPAPRWCYFLESLTEELEENANPTVYDDYRFVTRTDLDKLGLTHLIGTPLLRSYMHGFFVDNRLYQKAKSIADPFAYETYRAKRVAEKLEEERKSRISVVRKLPKVNAAMAARIMVEEAQKKDTAFEKEISADADEKPPAESKIASGAPAPSLLEDDRFKAMFEDPEFAIDERSEEYRILHPNANPDRDRKLLSEHFEELGGDILDLEEDSDRSDAPTSDSEYDSEDENYHNLRRRKGAESKKLREGEGLIGQTQKLKRRMFAARDDASASAFREQKSLVSERELPLGQRTILHQNDSVHPRIGGNRELTFKPRMAPDGPRSRGRGNRRGKPKR